MKPLFSSQYHPITSLSLWFEDTLFRNLKISLQCVFYHFCNNPHNILIVPFKVIFCSSIFWVTLFPSVFGFWDIDFMIYTFILFDIYSTKSLVQHISSILKIISSQTLYHRTRSHAGLRSFIYSIFLNLLNLFVLYRMVYMWRSEDSLLELILHSSCVVASIFSLYTSSPCQPPAYFFFKKCKTNYEQCHGLTTRRNLQT